MSEIATEMPDRFEVLENVSKVVKTGDVFYRGSMAKGYYGLPFMSMVARQTQSDLTHAAVCHWDNRVLRVVEQTDTGLVELRFIDWYTLCLNGRFAVDRLSDRPDWFEVAFNESLKWNLLQDWNYNGTFSNPNNRYCTELVCNIYEHIGFKICEPKLLKDILRPGIYPLVRAFNPLFKILTDRKQSLPYKTPMYYVGNKTNGGMRASPIMYEVFSHMEGSK